MSRRILICSLALVFLFASLLLGANARVFALTPTVTPSVTPMPTSPSEFVGSPLTGSAPLTVQFTHIGGNGPIVYCVWTFADGTSQTFSATAAGSNPFPACPSVSHTYSLAGKYSPVLTSLTNNGNPQGSKTNFDYVQIAGPTPTATTTNNPVPDLVVQALVYLNSNPPCPDNPLVKLSIANNGGAVNTPFQVTFNGETRTVNGIGVHQGITLDFNGVSGTKTAIVDSTNVIAETNESNNSMTFLLPALSSCGGPSLTPTRTFTPTNTVGASPTRTSTLAPWTPTPTRTSTPSITPTGSVGACAPVTSTITAPFTFDGAGTFCWQSSNLGTYINSWNTTSVSVNGVNESNLYVAAASYPAKIGGFWYVTYNSSVAWGHLETK